MVGDEVVSHRNVFMGWGAAEDARHGATENGLAIGAATEHELGINVE